MSEWFKTYFTGLYGEVLAATFSEADSLAQAELVAGLLDLRPGQAVLDVPCGMGRLSLPLARMGLRVTGVDIERRFVERARRECARNGLDARFVAGDMREISFDCEFDAAFNWFTSFGYFGDEDNFDFLCRVRAALGPGGRWAVELVNKAWLVMNLSETSSDRLAGVRIDTRRDWDAASSRMSAETVFSKGARTERREQSVRVYSPLEMRELLGMAGFEDIRILAADGMSKADAGDVKFIAVARRGSAQALGAFEVTG